MHDVVAIAEQLLAAPSTVKVADAPVLVVSPPGTHQHTEELRKIAAAIRLEGLTVEEPSIDDVISGAAMGKIAGFVEPQLGVAISVSPIAAEARALASELRKFAADKQRAAVSQLELELERAVIAEHEKLAAAAVAH